MNTTITIPMNDVFGDNFISMLDPYFTAAKTEKTRGRIRIDKSEARSMLALTRPANYAWIR